MKKTISYLTLALLMLAVGAAHANLPQKVQQALRGQIIITKAGFKATGDDDAETISALKKAHLKEVSHTLADDVAEWSFDYLAFLNKPPKVTSLSVDFYTADKARRYVANKRLMGIDPNLTVLSGTLTINEDDGPTRGKTYLVRVTGKVKNKDVTFAETTLTLK